MKVEIFYDTLCSWCRVGKVHFKKAIEKLEKEGKINPNDIEVIYRSYVIYPELPVEGIDYQQALIDDDDLEKIDPAHDTPIHRWGKRIGMEFNFEKIKVKPNTYQAHQFLHMIDKQYVEPMIVDIHREFFENGNDINNLDYIGELAEKYISKTEVEDIKKRVRAGEKLDEVNADIDIAENYNIDLVPLYVFDGKVKLEGAILQKKFEEALLGQIEPNM